MNRHVGRLRGQFIQHVVFDSGGLDHVLRQGEQAQITKALVGEHT